MSLLKRHPCLGSKDAQGGDSLIQSLAASFAGMRRSSIPYEILMLTLWKSLTTDPKRSQLIALVLFVALGLVGIVNHAMWRDELNVWLIVRDSVSLADFLANVKYEGHPLLWYLSLAVLNQFTDDPVVMQLYHLALGIGSMVLLWRAAPFAPWQKLLLMFGYYPFYEYLLISRNYAIGMLFLFSFCVAWPTRRRTYGWVGLFIALMANCNAYAFFIGFALLVTLAVEWLSDPKIRAQSRVGDLVGSGAIALLGLASAAYVLIPPADSALQGGLSRWFFQWDWHHLGRSLSRIWSAYVVVLVPGDSKVFDGVLFGIISLGLLGFFAIALLKRPVALFFYLFASLEIVTFTYVKFLGSLRHYGSLYLVLIAALWIAADCTARSSEKLPLKVPLTPLYKRVKSLQKPVFTVILTAQFVAGLIAYTRDYITPFSASKATTAYIQQENLDMLFMVGSRDANMAPICGYLNRKMYYPERGELGSFTLFNSQRTEATPDLILDHVTQLLKAGKPELLLVLNAPLAATRPELAIAPLAEFRNGLIGDEHYFLYRVKLARAATRFPPIPVRSG